LTFETNPNWYVVTNQYSFKAFSSKQTKLFLWLWGRWCLDGDMINSSNCDNSASTYLTLFWRNHLLNTKNETARISLTCFWTVFIFWVQKVNCSNQICSNYNCLNLNCSTCVVYIKGLRLWVLLNRINIESIKIIPRKII